MPTPLPNRRQLCLAAGALALAAPLARARAPQDERVRVAFIDPLSGPVGGIGRNGLRSWSFMARHFSEQAQGPRFLVAGFDNNGSPQESLNMLKVAIDQGFRYVVQGNGSGVAAALSDAIARHNARLPERAVLYLNYAAADPVLTGEKCNHWHFRIDADTGMKMRALTAHMAEQPALRRVFLLNQNYAHGQQVSRHFKEAMVLRRADVQVVGDELHPAFALRDFSSLAQRVRDSGAQAVVTGNWGPDLNRLVEALERVGSRAALYTYYASLTGTPQVLARHVRGFDVFQIAYSHGLHGGVIGQLAAAFRRLHREDLVIHATYTGMQLLSQAVQAAGTTHPRVVAARLSGWSADGFDGPVHMRAEDHQLQQGLYLSRWQALASDQGQGAEATGHAFVPVRHFGADEVATTVTCEMSRP